MNNDSNFKTYIQSNLVNLKPYGLVVLLRSIKRSKYRELDIKYISPQMIIVSVLLSIIRFWCTKKKRLSETFLLCTKTYVFIDKYSNSL